MRGPCAPFVLSAAILLSGLAGLLTTPEAFAQTSPAKITQSSPNQVPSVSKPVKPSIAAAQHSCVMILTGAVNLTLKCSAELIAVPGPGNSLLNNLLFSVNFNEAKTEVLADPADLLTQQKVTAEFTAEIQWNGPLNPTTLTHAEMTQYGAELVLSPHIWVWSMAPSVMGDGTLNFTAPGTAKTVPGTSVYSTPIGSASIALVPSQGDTSTSNIYMQLQFQ